MFNSGMCYFLFYFLHYIFIDFFLIPFVRVNGSPNICRENGMPSKQSKICSDHFTENYLDRTGKIVRLLRDAVSTSFKAFPKHFQQVSNFCLLVHFYSFIMFFHILLLQRPAHRK